MTKNLVWKKTLAAVLAVLTAALFMGTAGAMNVYASARKTEPPVKSYEYSYLHGKWKLQTKNYYNYDRHGSLSKTVSVNLGLHYTMPYKNYYKNGQLYKYHVDEDTYRLDSDYNVILDTSDPVDGGIVTTSTYTYQNGLPVSYHRSDNQGGEEKSERYETTTYPDGTMKKCLTYDENGVLSDENFYNKKGLVTEWISYDSDGNIDSRDTTHYSYDRKGRVVKKVEYDNGKPNFMYKYFYNNKTKKINRNLFLQYFM